MPKTGSSDGVTRIAKSPRLAVERLIFRMRQPAHVELFQQHEFKKMVLSSPMN